MMKWIKTSSFLCFEEWVLEWSQEEKLDQGIYRIGHIFNISQLLS